MFDFTQSMRRLCEDIVDRSPELQHVRMDRVAVCFAQARKRVAHGLWASLTPLRFQHGTVLTHRRGRCYRMQTVLQPDGREYLYILRFYLPRFLDLPFPEALETVFHELWHIHPTFNGDIRRFPGRCHAHSTRKQEYDQQVAVLARDYLQRSPSDESLSIPASRQPAIARHIRRHLWLPHPTTTADPRRQLTETAGHDIAAVRAHALTPCHRIDTLPPPASPCPLPGLPPDRLRRMPRFARPLRMSLTISLVVWGGCASSSTVWEHRPKTVLREMMLAEDHSVLEVAVVSWTDDAEQPLQSIWQECDEQTLPVDTRRALQRNGLRAGVCGMQLPAALREALDERERTARSRMPQLTSDAEANAPWTMQRLRVRPDQLHDILTSSVREELTVFVHEPSGLNGRTLPLGQTLFAMTPRGSNAGHLILELVPEIHYGLPQHQYTAALEGAFRLENRRQQLSLTELAFTVDLSPGESLLVGSSGPTGSVGSVFFDRQPGTKLLLIRLAATQHEPLFSEEEPPPQRAGL